MKEIRNYNSIEEMNKDDELKEELYPMEKWDGECWETMFNTLPTLLPEGVEANPWDLLASFIHKALVEGYEKVEESSELYLDDVTGTLGEWLDMDTSEIPVEAMKLIQEAYKICVNELEV